MDWLSLVAEQIQQLGEGPFRFVVVVIAYLFLRELRKMRGSMDKLHKVLSDVVNKLNGHEKRIRQLERK